jgi:hypothetical protein
MAEMLLIEHLCRFQVPQSSLLLRRPLNLHSLLILHCHFHAGPLLEIFQFAFLAVEGDFGVLSDIVSFPAAALTTTPVCVSPLSSALAQTGAVVRAVKARAATQATNRRVTITRTSVDTTHGRSQPGATTRQGKASVRPYKWRMNPFLKRPECSVKF